MERNIIGYMFLFMFRIDCKDFGMCFLVNYLCVCFYLFLLGEKEKIRIFISLGIL